MMLVVDVFRGVIVIRVQGFMIARKFQAVLVPANLGDDEFFGFFIFFLIIRRLTLFVISRGIFFFLAIVKILCWYFMLMTKNFYRLLLRLWCLFRWILLKFSLSQLLLLRYHRTCPTCSTWLFRFRVHCSSINYRNSGAPNYLIIIPHNNIFSR